MLTCEKHSKNGDIELKKLIKKIRFWLIRKLGGIPVEASNIIVKQAVSQIVSANDIALRLRYVIKQICRRDTRPDGTATYYDFACEYCNSTCANPVSWCTRFCPKEFDKEFDKETVKHA